MRMKKVFPYRFAPVVAALIFSPAILCPAQQSLTWEQVKARFESSNPALTADALSVDEISKGIPEVIEVWRDTFGD